MLYLVGLFGIAFVIVLGSLWARGSFGDPDAIQQLESRVSALDQQLDTERSENRRLMRENEDLSTKADDLEAKLNETIKDLEYIEGEAANTEAQADLLRRQSEAELLLIRAQAAMLLDDPALARDLTEQLKQDAVLPYLSEDARTAFDALIAQIEEIELPTEGTEKE